MLTPYHIAFRDVLKQILVLIVQVVASPADLVKVRMQADGRRVSQGLKPRYTGFVDALSKIINAEGFRGLWRGVFPNVQKAFLVNMGCPANVVKTRMMNQVGDEDGKFKYRNSYDCLVKTVRFEGFRALWKGFFPTWARLGPWQFVFWVSYEKFRLVLIFGSDLIPCRCTLAAGYLRLVRP
ncbi:hypothetical protein L1987_16370 [Smallanthus sonchifolius]|uniref:Uncharacterized protein n=1 Tax=Smallanthus sonchifolius TaxID=185202 RepID=A0ACB9J8J0_9ASTR|nr:hypothetical protein L1987_16370 [Smallanthus sonchifolius]